jgi:hypothetical protein
MEVTDSVAAPAASTAGKEEVRTVGDEPGNSGRSRPGQGFRSTLERRRRDPIGGANEAASAAAMAAWFRPESAPTAKGVAAVAAPRAVDRVLIGSGPGGAQARIRIGAGTLAGTEIQLSAAASGHAVEARLLTHGASSRQTLSVVMDEIRSRLRDRGIVLSTRATASTHGREPDGTVASPRRRPDGQEGSPR